MIPSTMRRLKNAASINDDQLDEKTSPDHVFEYVDVGAVGRGILVDEPEKMRFEEAPSRARRLVRVGDTIVSTVRTYLRAILPITANLGDVVVSTGFAVVRPRPTVDRRFLSWALQADSFVEEVVARSVGVSYPAIAPSAMADIKLTVPLARQDQRLIAAFLDRETQRIDALVGAKRQMIDLLKEKRSAIRDKALGSLGSAILAPLKRRADVTVGIVVQPARLYTDDGVPVLRGLNVGEGEVSQRGLRFISEKANREHSKSVLRDGDVVVVRTGQAGAAAVVPSWAIGGNCVDLLLVRPSPGLNSKYLEYWLNSSLTAHQVEKFSVGAIQSHYNVGALRELLVAVPSPAQQQTIVDELGRREGAIMKAVSILSAQIALLAEYRQALVTKAVAGELDEATLKGEKPADEVVSA